MRPREGMKVAKAKGRLRGWPCSSCSAQVEPDYQMTSTTWAAVIRPSLVTSGTPSA